MDEARLVTVTDTAQTSGSGDAFVDGGIADGDAHIVKADLVARIDAIVRQRGMTQSEAGRLLGLSQPAVSRLLRGDFRNHSLERLLRILTTLGRDIDIVIRQPRSRTGGKLRVAASDAA
ncbi:MAG: XRE family transcriptional regulator [Gemmatimonadetes bacterium]|nr:XRE family transcriptional regulator [Gemmatimonadota bacterium]